MLVLSNDAEEDRRAKIIDDVRQAISSGGGSIAHDNDWGTRPLAYRIAHQGDGEYHLLQFTGPPTLLDSLGHTLKITDGVLRFRIIKVLPGTPGPPRPEPAPVTASARPEPASSSSAAAPAAQTAAPEAPTAAQSAAEPEVPSSPEAGAEAPSDAEAPADAEAPSDAETPPEAEAGE